MKKGGLLNNLWDKGELPTVTTDVTFSNRTLISLAIVVVAVAAIIILSNKVVKSL